MSIRIQADVYVPVDKVWEYYTNPEHVINWNFASDDWECLKAENKLVPGGRFFYRMAAKDKSIEFDFQGIFKIVITNHQLTYKLDDDREVKVLFLPATKSSTWIIITLDPDKSHDEEFQRLGWQSILNNFKKYAESRTYE